MKKPTKETATTTTTPTEVARLVQQARELRTASAARVAALTEQLAEAKWVHKAAVAHEKTWGSLKKNVLREVGP